MKVLLINGSPRKEGNTYLALSAVASALQANGDVSLADGVLNWDGAYSRMHFTRK